MPTIVTAPIADMLDHFELMNNQRDKQIKNAQLISYFESSSGLFLTNQSLEQIKNVQSHIESALATILRLNPCHDGSLPTTFDPNGDYYNIVKEWMKVQVLPYFKAEQKAKKTKKFYEKYAEWMGDMELAEFVFEFAKNIYGRLALVNSQSETDGALHRDCLADLIRLGWLV